MWLLRRFAGKGCASSIGEVRCCLSLIRGPRRGAQEQVPAVIVSEAELGRRARRLQPERGHTRGVPELLRRHRRRERQRKHDGCDHANGDEQGVKAEQVAQLVGEHAVDCLSQQAELRQRSAAEGGNRDGTAIKRGGANRGAGCGAFTLRIKQKANRAVSEKLQAFAN